MSVTYISRGDIDANCSSGRIYEFSLYEIILFHILRILIYLIFRASLVLRVSITIIILDFRHSL